MKFYARDNELDQLIKRFESDRAEAILVYGRRRVGKSTLIMEAIRQSHVNSIYFLAKETNMADNLASLSALVEQNIHPPVHFNSLEDFFTFMYDYARNQSFVIVIDEYPYMNRLTNGLSTVVQAVIDRFGHDSHLKLVLCGSSIEVMKQLIEYENPLYGRFTFVLPLEEMDYYDSAFFYPDFADSEKVALYSVFGGIPFYNQKIDPNKTVDENIIGLIVSKNGPLFSEVPFFLQSELGKIENANIVLETIGKGYVKFSDILSQSHLKSSPILAQTIKRLMNLKIIKKIEPINCKGNHKRAQYTIADNFMAFYYRYIYPNASRLSVMNETDFFEMFIKPDFYTQFVPRAFEQIAAQFLIRKNRERLIDPPFFELGKYYYDDPLGKKNGEFDIVTRDQHGYIFYECKFRNDIVKNSDIQNEIVQVRQCGLDAYHYGFFAKSGFEVEKTDNISLYTLEQLYQ